MNAPHPTRQAALVGEARASCDFGQTGLPVANQLDRSSQPEMHDPAVRGHANRTGEHAGEVERAAPRYFCQRSDLDRFIGRSLLSAHVTVQTNENFHAILALGLSKKAQPKPPRLARNRLVGSSRDEGGGSRLGFDFGSARKWLHLQCAMVFRAIHRGPSPAPRKRGPSATRRVRVFRYQVSGLHH